MNYKTTLLCSLLCLCTTPVLAQPLLTFVDNSDGSVTLQVIPSAPDSSIATEISTTVSVGDVSLTNVSVNSEVFDFENPGLNPFTETVTFGLWQNNNDIFASFGSQILSGTEPVDFLHISFEGTGTIEASGLVADNGQVFTGLTASIEVSNVVPEPVSALLFCIGTLGLLGRRGL